LKISWENKINKLSFYFYLCVYFLSDNFMKFPYDIRVESQMYSYYTSLSERQKRLYAGIEALKLGFGGKKYICQVLKISSVTLRRGIADLSAQSEWVAAYPNRQRIAGGGRKNFVSSKSH
jgi:hypothetical protein